MALTEINLTSLVDVLDEAKSEYADFFRPMLGYDAILKLYEGIEDDVESLLVEIEDETGYEFPSDLIELYMCTNGGEFGDLELFPITTDKDVENNIHKYNVIDKSIKESIGLSDRELLVGKYIGGNNYVICRLNEENVYEYQLWDSHKKETVMTFEFLIQLIALEISYITDYDGLVDLAANSEE